jgi:hypothetical protein
MSQTQICFGAVVLSGVGENILANPEEVVKGDVDQVPRLAALGRRGAFHVRLTSDGW